MPLLPASIIEPLWVEFAALIGSNDRPEFDPTHPWGCHRRRIPDRVVFDHLIAALVHGSGYERIATPGCSDRTLRRRLDSWAEARRGSALLRICLAAYDRIIGLDLDELAVDGCITKAPCGGEVAGRSPVDRGKQGTNRSVASDGGGLPLNLVAARANDHDSPLLELGAVYTGDVRPWREHDRRYRSGLPLPSDRSASWDVVVVIKLAPLRSAATACESSLAACQPLHRTVVSPANDLRSPSDRAYRIAQRDGFSCAENTR